MGQVTRQFTYSAGAVIVAANHNTNENTLYNLVNGNLDTTNLSASAGIVDTQLASISTSGKVNISALVAASQATGDLIYASSASAFTRLPVGTSSQVLIGGTTPSFGNIPAAAQSDMETATSTTLAVTPGRAQYHPGTAKAWASFNGSGTPAMIASYNFDSSITDNGTGDWTLAITTDFSGSGYCAIGSFLEAPGTRKGYVQFQTKAAGTIRVLAIEAASGTLVDIPDVNVLLFGDQA